MYVNQIISGKEMNMRREIFAYKYGNLDAHEYGNSLLNMSKCLLGLIRFVFCFICYSHHTPNPLPNLETYTNGEQPRW